MQFVLFTRCPTDLPTGVTATPQCALQDASTHSKYCALICSPGSNDQCLGNLCKSPPWEDQAGSNRIRFLSFILYLLVRISYRHRSIRIVALFWLLLYWHFVWLLDYFYYHLPRQKKIFHFLCSQF